MKCPNCGYSLTGNVCPNCAIDTIVFDKTLKISDVLYNKGLSLAKVHDLSGALDSLTKSIQFNKNNHYARNLLGLVYYEMGRIGDALKQWVISASLMKVDNPAVRYINEIQRAPKRLDAYDDAISMYNSALQYIHQKADDMALIQLKKAIDLNPNSIDAMNLLAFCHIIQKDFETADILVENVLQIDINNPIALNYFKELHPNRQRKNNNPPKEVVKPINPALAVNKVTFDEKSHRNLFGTNFFFAEIISFVLGGLCILLLMLFTYVPGAIAEKDSEIAVLKEELSLSDINHENEISDIKKALTDLQRDYYDLEDENERLVGLTQTQDKSQRLQSAKTQYESTNYVEAAAIIYSMDSTGLSDESVRIYNELKVDAYNAAASTLFNRGTSNFSSENNEEARRELETCLLYAEANANYVDDATYLLGQLAERAEDIELAIKYYKSVVENYPDSNRLSAARARLISLEE